MTIAELEALAADVAKVLIAAEPLEAVAVGLVRVLVDAITGHLSSADALSAAEAQWVADVALSQALMQPPKS